MPRTPPGEVSNFRQQTTNGEDVRYEHVNYVYSINIKLTWEADKRASARSIVCASSAALPSNVFVTHGVLQRFARNRCSMHVGLQGHKEGLHYSYMFRRPDSWCGRMLYVVCCMICRCFPVGTRPRDQAQSVQVS